MSTSYNRAPVFKLLKNGSRSQNKSRNRSQNKSRSRNRSMARKRLDSMKLKQELDMGIYIIHIPVKLIDTNVEENDIKIIVNDGPLNPLYKNVKVYKSNKTDFTYNYSYDSLKLNKNNHGIISQELTIQHKGNYNITINHPPSIDIGIVRVKNVKNVVTHNRGSRSSFGHIKFNSGKNPTNANIRRIKEMLMKK
jgi:hypothetical protein